MTQFAIPGLMEVPTPIMQSDIPRLSLAPHRLSNTEWVGIPSITLALEVAAPTIEYAELQLFRIGRNVAEHTLTGEDKISITTGDTTEVAVLPQPLDIRPGHWEGHLITRDAAGKAQTWLRCFLEIIP